MGGLGGATGIVAAYPLRAIREMFPGIFLLDLTLQLVPVSFRLPLSFSGDLPR